MSLPIRTNPEDINAVCKYLVTKPTGATLAEAKAVVDNKHLVGQKITALKNWGIIESDGNKIKVTDRGRLAVREEGAFQSAVLLEVVGLVEPYKGIIERVIHRQENTLAATDVAAHWHEHFNTDVADQDKTLNEQAICFFQIAQGADLGRLTIGRKGMRTRFDFHYDNCNSFLDSLVSERQLLGPEVQSEDSQRSLLPYESNEVEEQSELSKFDPILDEIDDETVAIEPIKLTQSNRVFITHGKNLGILEQVKEIVEFGKYEPVVAMEHETTAKPVPQKVMDEMRSCWAAVIHVSADGVLYDENGKEVPQINGNVLIEIGAAMAFYGDKFILLVEDGLKLPSNLQGLYECRYKGDELSWATTRKLLKAFNEF